MGQLRKLKRKFERESRKRSMQDLYAYADRVSEEHEQRLRREYKQARIDEDTKNMTYAMYYLFGIHLHELFGFGGQRCLRLFEAIDRELGTWRRGEVTVGDLQKKLYDAIGIDIRLDGGTHE